MNLNFENQTIVVTGGTSGIGKAIANQFISLGGNVIITGRSETPPNNLSCEMNYYQLDILNEESLDIFLDKLSSEKKIDVLVNNAGINIISELEKINYKDYEDILKVNLHGPFIISKTLAPLMKAEGGKIINIGSIWSKITKKGRVSYTTSKSGLAGLTRALATDLGEYNILVNTVSPGFTITDLTKRSLSKKEINEITKMIPMRRMADTKEIAQVVLFLASNLNTYITGQNILADGGFSNV